MKINSTKYYEQTVNDDGNVLVADFTAQSSNGSVQNINISVNTVMSYQNNREKVIAAFDDFLSAIQADSVSESATDITSDSTSDSTSALSQ